MNINQDQAKIDEDALLQYGRKLGFLIGSSTLPKEIKDELVSLILHMKIDQIERLMAIFEAKYLDEKTRHIDDEFKQKLGAIVENYKKKTSEEENTLANLIKNINLL
jgi:hypothetical protein